MVFPKLKQGVFCKRLNRFLAEVELDGEIQKCHVKNTGRLGELLRPGAEVWCEIHDDPARKTRYSLLLVRKDGRLVSIDSQAPNRLAYEYLMSGGLGTIPQKIRREVTCGDSRFDLWFEQNGQPAWMEVKGVTLETDGIARFPDAPTERGAKHVRGLQRIAQEGGSAYVLFVIQMTGIKWFEPNEASDPDFAAALREAAENGVRILAVSCDVTLEGIKTTAPVEVRL